MSVFEPGDDTAYSADGFVDDLPMLLPKRGYCIYIGCDQGAWDPKTRRPDEAGLVRLGVVGGHGRRPVQNQRWADLNPRDQDILNVQRVTPQWTVRSRPLYGPHAAGIVGSQKYGVYLLKLDRELRNG